VLTALRVEYEAVRQHLDKIIEIQHPEGDVYERGMFGTDWEVGIVEVGMGNPNAAQKTTRAIAYFEPEVVLFVGVAGGIKDVKIGDVVVATKVYAYDVGKGAYEFQPRPELVFPHYRILERARAEARKQDWLVLLGKNPDTNLTVFLGPIAAGEQVVVDFEANAIKIIHKTYSDALALEMEGFGFLHAASSFSNIQALVVRGISDLLEGKEEADKSGSKERASRHAAAFAFQVLTKLTPQQTQPLTENDIEIEKRHTEPLAKPSNLVLSTKEMDAKVSNTFSKYGYKTILRSPAVCFLFGEHAVTAGHPALCLPIPLYIYVGIKELKQPEETGIWYFENTPNGLEKEPYANWDYCEKIAETITQVAPQAPPLQIALWSQAPTMCGLGTSSAISACISKYLVSRDYVPKVNDLRNTDTLYNVNLLGHNDLFDKIFRIAWKLDLAFHGEKGSGVGVFTTLAGNSGPNPLLYFSAARKKWSDDISTFPCWGFRLKPPNNAETFKSSHFALLHTGHVKHTKDTLVDSFAHKNFGNSPGMADKINKVVKSCNKNIHYNFQPSINWNTEEINVDPTDPYEILVRHLAVSREELTTAYGIATLSGINSFWSKNDYSYLALMEACQCVLEVLRLADITRRGEPTTWEPYALAQIINSTSASDGSRLFGAKITGGGMGGDILVASSQTTKDGFSTELEKAIDNARKQFHSSYEDFGKVHFSTTWLQDYPSGYDASGTALIQGAKG